MNTPENTPQKEMKIPGEFIRDCILQGIVDFNTIRIKYAEEVQNRENNPCLREWKAKETDYRLIAAKDILAKAIEDSPAIMEILQHLPPWIGVSMSVSARHVNFRHVAHVVAWAEQGENQISGREIPLDERKEIPLVELKADMESIRPDLEVSLKTAGEMTIMECKPKE